MFKTKVAELYDEVTSAGYHNQQRYVDELVRIIPKGSSVLELGAGTGNILIPLCKEGISVEGVDSSDSMLERLRDKKKEAVFYNADVRYFIPSKLYDFVLSCNGPFSIIEGEITSYLLDEKELRDCLNKYSLVAKEGILVNKGSEKDRLRLKLSGNREFVHREVQEGDLLIMIHLLYGEGAFLDKVVDIKRKYSMDVLADRKIDDLGDFFLIHQDLLLV